MGIDRFRATQLIFNSDRVSVYRAVDANSVQPVELWILDRLADEALAWRQQRAQIQRAAIVDHPAVKRIVEQSLYEPPLYVVRTWRDQVSLRERFAAEVPLPPSRALIVIRSLADILAAAHRVGCAHGRLSPDTISWLNSGGIEVDLTGLDAYTSDTLNRWNPFDLEADLIAAGEILSWLLTGVTAITGDVAAKSRPSATMASLTSNPQEAELSKTLRELADRLRSQDAIDLPSVDDLLRQLTQLADSNIQGADLNVTQVSSQGIRLVSETAAIPDRLGRFRIVSRIGQGGMGVVYKAEDITDGTIAAVKILKAELAQNPKSLKRFEKEARMLAAVRNSNVVNLLDVNQDAGIHYLAMEFVAGRTLRAVLEERGKVGESESLSIIADVCRGLAEAHAKGIVHRDIKPENILLAETESGESQVKLTDFGLARQIEQSESLDLTQENLVGTPLYMAPEQGYGGGTIDARSDVYSMGATLFHLLAGQAPFQADSPMAVLMLHAHEALPNLQQITPATSDGARRLVERAMAKAPVDRFADAAVFLAEIERHLRGEPSSLAIHPLAPKTDPDWIIHYDFHWECASSPEQLWPFVSNTERLNKAIGLPSVAFTSKWDGSRVRRFGRIRKAGIVSTWEEYPFEWIEGRRMGVLRVIEQGPFEWLTSVVELSPLPSGGTRLAHRFQVVPRNFIGRIFAAVEIGFKARRALNRVYMECDATIQRRKPGAVDDPFEPSVRITGRQRQRLQQGIARLLERGVSPPVAERFEEYLSEAPSQSMSRIRPLAVADTLGVDASQFVSVCLHAANDGMLSMLWDILCPICRIPSQIQDSLRTIKEHGRCEACNLDFELDFANSVELIFRADPSIRTNELGTFCIGGPAHSPHVAAQARVAAGERIELGLQLAEGSYRFRGPQLPYAIDFRVAPSSSVQRWEVLLSRRPDQRIPVVLAPNGQALSIVNDSQLEAVICVERTAPRNDALTAARAASLPLFRQLFPAETLAPGQMVSLTQLTLLVTELDGIEMLYRELGEAQSFERLHEHFRLADDAIRNAGGAVVKTTERGLVSSFHEPAAAVRAAFAIPRPSDLGMRVGIHRGSAFAVTINDRLDYFGSAVNLALSLPRIADSNSVLLTASVATETAVIEFLDSQKLKPELIGLHERFAKEPCAHQFRIRDH